MDSAIVVLDGTGRVLRLNDRARQTIGRSREACLGATCRELGAEEPWRTGAALVAQAPHESTGFREVRDAATGRSWHLALTRTTEFVDDARLILVAWDVTSMIEPDQAVRQSDRITALDVFAAGVAHEVRNPLFAISANMDALDVVLRGRADVTDLIAAIHREVARLNQLMADLIEYGKARPATLSEQPLADAVDAAAPSCAALAERSGVGIQWPRGDCPWLVTMDRRRMTQAIEALVEDAIDHSPPGSVVRLEHEGFREDGHQWVRLRVSDSGLGFRDEDLSRVFEPFSTHRRGGSGLRLSIAQRIVEQHAGRIGASNREAGGAILTLELPCVAGPAQ